jgi:hypothetical protein
MMDIWVWIGHFLFDNIWRTLFLILLLFVLVMLFGLVKAFRYI